MKKKPSSIFSKKESKLTRRRIMKMATSVGIPTATAMSLTAEDVKASDSDEVTIAFDVSGENKKQVPADWYNHVRRAKDVRDKISSKFMPRDGVKSVGVVTKPTPFVVVRLESGNPKKEERRSEVPEYQRDVRVKIREQDYTMASRHNESENDCPPHQVCNDQTTNTSQVPGGIQVSPFNGSNCTNGPRFVNGSCKDFRYGWSTAAHCLNMCHDMDSIGNCTSEYGCGVTAPEEIFHNGDLIGEAVCVDHNLDIAYIERNDSFLSESEPEPEIVLPSNHSNTIHITDTVSESGMDTVVNNSDYPVTYRGIRSCEIGNGQLLSVDNTFNLGDKAECTDSFEGQFVVGLDYNHVADGDSGSVPYVKDSGKYYAIGSIRGGTCQGPYNYAGPQGYTIRNRHNIWWSD